MLRKIISVVVVILVLALVGLTIREHVAPPQPALAGSTTLTPLSGENVFLNGDKVDDTVRIGEGDTITTGADSWALVTFEDGSTIELEPDTEISISTLTDTSISVWQEVGHTWSGVKKLASGPINDFEINTPSAGAVVQGTLIETVVENIKDSLIAAFEGTVKVTAEDITQILMAGMQSLIEYGQPPQTPQPIPLPKNTLEFTIDGSAWALVVDDQQRSVGVVPPGIVVNQIPKSSTTGAQSAPQFIVAPVDEKEGTKTYYVVLYGKDDGGNMSVGVKGYTEGNEIFAVTKNKVVGTYDKDGKEETKYVATLEVTVDADGDITSSELGDFVLAKNHADFDSTMEGWPSKVDIKDWATVNTDEAVAPQANFGTSNVDGKIHFTNLSTGDITSYTWNFGDGSEPSTDMSPTHEYEEGEYVVSLTVSGPAGEDTVIKTFYIIFV